MKSSFDINIPSIPGRTIKFKIQDIKTAVFGSQVNRFHENKAFLTRKFIESFSNFSEKVRDVDKETDTCSNTSYVSQPYAKQEYRVVVPEEKKHMLQHFDKYKHYQAPIPKETKYNRGYSFYKTGPSLPQSRKNNYSYSIENNSISDNLFFPSNKVHPNRQPRDKPKLPSCVFKNQTRTRIYTKQHNQISKLGPGQYYQESLEQEMKKPEPQKIEQGEIDLKHLKKIITNVVGKEQDVTVKGEEEKQKQVKIDYMFMKDDRDRFGDHKYPIVNRAQIPGPGTYNVKNSIEERTQKVVIVEEQRRLLKEWFNN